MLLNEANTVKQSFYPATFQINGEAKFTIPFSRISQEVDPYSYTPLVQRLNGYHVTVKASVTESLNNLTRNASSTTQFYQQPYRVSFISSQSPTFFKPGLPYKAFVSNYHVTLNFGKRQLTCLTKHSCVDPNGK